MYNPIDNIAPIDNGNDGRVLDTNIHISLTHIIPYSFISQTPSGPVFRSHNNALITSVQKIEPEFFTHDWNDTSIIDIIKCREDISD